MKAVLLALCLLLPLAAAAQDDCRMRRADLRPLIAPDNRWFTHHLWDDSLKVESARMGPGRVLTLEQQACLRHSITLTLQVDADQLPRDPVIDGPWFVRETLLLLDRLWPLDPAYWEFRAELRQALAQHYDALRGPGIKLPRINFPIADRSFITAFRHTATGVTLELQIVKLLHTEAIRRPGIPDYRDDAWRK